MCYHATSLGGATAPDEQPAPAKRAELRRLMVERYEAAWAEVEVHSALFNAGRVSLHDTCDAIRRFSSAGLDVAKTHEYRLTLCEYALDVAQKIEQSVKRKYETDVEPIQAMKLATYTRLDMEVKLHQVRDEAGADQADKKCGR